MSNAAPVAASAYGGLQPGARVQARDLPRSFVGIPPTTLEAGDAVEIQCDVQREMRPDRLILDGGSAGLLWGLVDDIKVGTVSLNASENPVPALCFSSTAWGASIRATMTAQPSIGIQLLARLDAAAGEDDWALTGAFVGPSAAPGAGVAGPYGAGAAVGGIVGMDSADDGAPTADDLPQSIVGIPLTTIAAGALRVPVLCRVQRDFRPDRLMLHSACTGLLINDVRVGVVSLNASLNPAAGALFSITSFGTRLRAAATATPSVGIQLIVSNPTVAPIVLRGGFFGPSRYATT